VLGAPCVADLEGTAGAQRCAVLPGGRLLATCAYWDCSMRCGALTAPDPLSTPGIRIICGRKTQ
jgi:hypothetical protein